MTFTCYIYRFLVINTPTIYLPAFLMSHLHFSYLFAFLLYCCLVHKHFRTLLVAFAFLLCYVIFLTFWFIFIIWNHSCNLTAWFHYLSFPCFLITYFLLSSCLNCNQCSNFLACFLVFIFADIVGIDLMTALLSYLVYQHQIFEKMPLFLLFCTDAFGTSIEPPFEWLPLFSLVFIDAFTSHCVL